MNAELGALARLGGEGGSGAACVISGRLPSLCCNKQWNATTARQTAARLTVGDWLAGSTQQGPSRGLRPGWVGGGGAGGGGRRHCCSACPRKSTRSTAPAGQLCVCAFVDTLTVYRMNCGIWSRGSGGSWLAQRQLAAGRQVAGSHV